MYSILYLMCFCVKCWFFNDVSKGLEATYATATPAYTIESTYSKYQHGCVLFWFVHLDILTYFILFHSYLILFMNKQVINTIKTAFNEIIIDVFDVINVIWLKTAKLDLKQ